MNEDQIKGVARKAGGTVVEFAGKAVNDRQLESRGYLNQALGTVQEGYGKVRERVKVIVDDAPATARSAIDTGRDYARRGSVAIARTSGDNTALMLLAAGAVGAAIGWLAWRRRGSRQTDA